MPFALTVDVQEAVRDAYTVHADFPKPGVTFIDVLPLLRDHGLLWEVMDQVDDYLDGKIDVIVAMDARGFLFAPLLAQEMMLPVLCVRKAGKLPGRCATIGYGLEYGSDAAQIQIEPMIELREKLGRKPRALLVDDLLATGGTLAAARELCELEDRALCAPWLDAEPSKTADPTAESLRAQANEELFQSAGLDVVAALVMCTLTNLHGADKLPGLEVISVLDSTADLTSELA